MKSRIKSCQLFLIYHLALRQNVFFGYHKSSLSTVLASKLCRFSLVPPINLCLLVEAFLCASFPLFDSFHCTSWLNSVEWCLCPYALPEKPVWAKRELEMACTKMTLAFSCLNTIRRAKISCTDKFTYVFVYQKGSWEHLTSMRHLPMEQPTAELGHLLRTLLSGVSASLLHLDLE